MGDNSSVDVLGLITTGQTESNCIMNIKSFNNINLKSELLHGFMYHKCYKAWK
ncbi:hypothetical protein TGAM01_v211177 [Trichoderma gamsii]|uniref:Uncharacterized protein n=1 Tax=Trichoderma gamsii TaxID=398673 RepID=A0A2P4Z6P9_9HYPO|nr:hypothetical protein TGAM01_v211177 [Trichoderma gamsii]PON19958.1 hypothetical protein TGAM01_v211177 [Trichoderma gamsii]